jgi:hypothetical protein
MTAQLKRYSKRREYSNFQGGTSRRKRQTSVLLTQLFACLMLDLQTDSARLELLVKLRMLTLERSLLLS